MPASPVVSGVGGRVPVDFAYADRWGSEAAVDRDLSTLCLTLVAYVETAFCNQDREFHGKRRLAVPRRLRHPEAEAVVA